MVGSDGLRRGAKLLSLQLSRLFDVSDRSYESAALTAELRAPRDLTS